MPFWGTLKHVAIGLLDSGWELRPRQASPANAKVRVRNGPEVVAVSRRREDDHDTLAWIIRLDDLNGRLEVGIRGNYDCGIDATPFRRGQSTG